MFIEGLVAEGIALQGYRIHPPRNAFIYAGIGDQGGQVFNSIVVQMQPIQIRQWSQRGQIDDPIVAQKQPC